jgi:biofilm PGA synthesis N-glycosyltransferase PgaC
MILVLVYSIFLLLATLLWWVMNPPYSIKNNEKITAIVVVRNEEESILTLLQSFKNQTYKNFEILIVDDHSTDKTADLILNFPLNSIKLLHLTEEERGSAPKKAGIEKALKLAEGSIIFSTDGDCKLPPKIFENYIDFFSNPSVHFISGPVTFFKEKTLWNAIQTVEFASLVGSAAVAIFLKTPIMSSAANLAYRKTSFLEVNGFEGNTKMASGDDEFLMNKINNTFPNSVVFAKNQECIVETKATKTLNQFYHQRKRWAGKWSVSGNIASMMTAVLVFLVNAITLYLAATAEWTVLTFRFVAEFIFLASVLYFFNKKSSIGFIPITQVFYPFYATFFGIISLFPGRYKWKGRDLK